MTEPKYLVLRKDGSIPQWPWFVLGANDPAAPAAMRAYAEECERLHLQSKYVRDVRALIDEFMEYRAGAGKPDGQPDLPDRRSTCEFVHRILRPRPVSVDDEVVQSPPPSTTVNWDEVSKTKPSSLQPPPGNY